MSKHCKVLYFIPNLQQGGAERQILELMNRLPERFETTLCLYERVIHYHEYLPDGEPRHVLEAPKMNARGFRRLLEVLDDERPTILHSYRDKANFWARLAAVARPVPVVLASCRNRQILPRYLVAEPFLSRVSDRVLANSEGVKRELIQRARVRPERVELIHNFIDLDKFFVPSEEQRRAARATLGLADDDVAILLPGRICFQKHQLGLTVALHLLRRRGQLSDRVRFLLAGRERDRIVAFALPRCASLLGVDRYLDRMGAVGDILPVYHAADALIMPSLFEGLPNAVLEAHACGLPAVVSHAANIDGLVLHGESGFEFRTFDHRGMAQALERMLALTTEERRRMGLRGRRHIEERFAPTRVLSEFVDLYDRLLEQKEYM